LIDGEGCHSIDYLVAPPQTMKSTSYTTEVVLALPSDNVKGLFPQAWEDSITMKIFVP